MSKLLIDRLPLPGLPLLGLLVLAGIAAPPTATLADQLQTEFDAALQAIEEDRLRTARNRLTALLAANPSLSRARLELARVHYLDSDYAQARTEARRVLDDPDAPPSVRVTILAFLAQIDADEKRFAARHQWAPSLYAGLMYDSNVNVGPSRDIINTGSVVCTPALPCTADSPEKDFAAVISPGIVHTYNPNRRFDWGEQQGSFLWESQANAYYRAYFDESDFNLGVLTLRTGPAWVVPGRWRAGVGLQLDQIFLGDESLALFSSLNPNISFQVGDNTEIALDGLVTQRHYWEDSEEDRDGWYRSASVLATRYFSERRFALQAGAGYSDFDADADRFGHSGPDLTGGLLWQAWSSGLVFARISYRRYEFDGPESFPFEDQVRDDDELRYYLGFQHDFRAGTLRNWSLLGSWTHTDNDSNVQIYEYDRDMLNLGLSRRF